MSGGSDEIRAVLHLWPDIFGTECTTYKLHVIFYRYLNNDYEFYMLFRDTRILLNKWYCEGTQYHTARTVANRRTRF